MTTDAIEVLPDRKINTPESANARLKAIRQVFKFGVKKKLAPSNPAREVEYFKSGSTGFHTWTPEEVQQFERRHPVGSKARLAWHSCCSRGNGGPTSSVSENSTRRLASSRSGNIRDVIG